MQDFVHQPYGIPQLYTPGPGRSLRTCKNNKPENESLEILNPKKN